MMFESSSKSRKSWNGRQITDDLVMHSRYLKQHMKTVCRLPWWFYVGEQSDRLRREEMKRKKKEVTFQLLVKSRRRK